MTVELAKLVDRELIQRARFTLSPDSYGGTQVQIIVHEDDRPTDDIQLDRFDTAGNAYAHIFRTFVRYFTEFSDDEIFGCDVSWNVGTHVDTAKVEVDLAKLIADAVLEQLEEEIEELALDELRGEGRPIMWGLLDYQTGDFAPQYTEYSSNPTKIVHADGKVEYLDEEGNPVDLEDDDADGQ